jgi:hypothetical protein
MNRLTPTVMALIVTSIGWPSGGTRLPFAGPAVLHAQQPAASRSSSRDKDDDKDDDADDDNDDDDTPASSAHGSAVRRTVDVARMLVPGRDATAPMHVDISYAAGGVSVVPADGPWLYDVRLNYLPEHDRPDISYDPKSRLLNVSANKHGDDINIDFGDHHARSDADVRVALGRGVPLDLSLKFGGGDVTTQLGGLSIQRLNFRTAGANAELSFNAPNPVPLADLDLYVAAVSFEATGLGNAHVQRMSVHAVAGDVDLDFGGQWTGDATLEVHDALGAVHIHVPHGVVVDDIGHKVVIGGYDNSAGGTVTPQTPGGPIYHLHLDTHAALGAIDVDRKTRE